MKVVLIDTGRGRNVASVELWRSQLTLTDSDDLALVSWQHPRVPLPVVEQLVFGPSLDWGRREPARPAVTLTPRPREAAPSVAHLPVTHPRRLAQAARWRARRFTRALGRRSAPLRARTLDRLPASWRRFPGSQLSGASPLAARLRKAAGLTSDGVATDFAVAVARSADAAELARWADVVVPFDARSRKAAWVLARRVEGPAVPLDVTSAVRVIAAARR